MNTKTHILSISDLDLTKSYTIGDYLTWQFDEMIELIKGKIYRMSPAPRSGHQDISTNTCGNFFNLLRKSNSTCRLYNAPFDVYLQGLDAGKTTVVQPDICIFVILTKFRIVVA